MNPPIIIPYGLRVFRVLAILNVLVTIFTILALTLFDSTLSTQALLMTVFIYVSALFSLCISVLTVIAINKRSAKIYKLLVWLFTIEIFILLGSIITTNIEAIAMNTMIFALSLFFLWYWIRVKGFFVDPSYTSEDPAIQRIDKKVNPFVITWLLVFFVGSLAIAGITSNQEMQRALNFKQQLEGKSFQEKLAFCATEDRLDTCRFVALSIERIDNTLTVEKCALLSDESTAAICYAMVDRCDQVANAEVNTTCEQKAQTYKEKFKSHATTTESNTAPDVNTAPESHTITEPNATTN